MKNFDLKDFLRTEFGSIAMIVFGGVLLFNPDFGSAALSSVLGWGLVASGAIGLLVSILSRPRLSNSAIIVSAIILVLGIYLLDHPLMLAKVLGIALGAILLKFGLGNWMEAKAVQKAGGPYLGLLFFSTAMNVIGITLILFPMSTSRVVMTLAGVFLIATGIGNIINHQRIKGYIDGHDYNPSIIDADE